MDQPSRINYSAVEKLVYCLIYIFVNSRRGQVTMSGENTEDNKTIRTAATVGTSPLWVPAAAAGGIVYGAGKGMLALNSLR